MERSATDITDPAVQAAFDAFEPSARRGLLILRDLIFEIAEDDDAIGRLEETLKWGQPAYLTSTTQSGTTIRLGVPKSGGFAIYTHCQTSVISDFRALSTKGLAFDGNRAVIFDGADNIPRDAVALLIRSALTYHLSKA